MGISLKWRTEEFTRIKKLTNKELLDEVLQLAGGDYYDGDFTTRGRWTYYRLKEELEKRLGEWLK